MNESDDEYRDSIEPAHEPPPIAGRPLPCWCRGRERAPLESLPIFQYFKAQYEAERRSSLVTPASVERGMGRGVPLGHSIGSQNLAGTTGSPDSDDDNSMNIVERFHRDQKPLNLPALTQRSSARVAMRDPPCSVPPAPRPPAPRPLALKPPGLPRPPAPVPPALKPQEGRRSENAGTSKHCLNSNWKAERSNTRPPATGGSQAQRQTPAAAKPARVKKRSFDPAEFANVGNLEWRGSLQRSRDVPEERSERSESSEEEDDEEDSEQSGGDAATAPQKRALAEELDDVVKPCTLEGSVSSSSECSTGEEVAPETTSLCTFEVTDLPKSVTEEGIFKIFSVFSEVSSVALTSGPAGVKARVMMTKACNVAWIKECLEETLPFGVGTRPLKIEIFEDQDL